MHPALVISRAHASRKRREHEWPALPEETASRSAPRRVVRARGASRRRLGPRAHRRPPPRAAPRCSERPARGPNAVGVDAFGNVYTANSRANNVTRLDAGRSVNGARCHRHEAHGHRARLRRERLHVQRRRQQRHEDHPRGSVDGPRHHRPEADRASRVDPTGNVYTANYVDSTVTRITPGGVSSTLAATGTHPARDHARSGGQPLHRQRGLGHGHQDHPRRDRLDPRRDRSMATGDRDRPGRERLHRQLELEERLEDQPGRRLDDPRQDGTASHRHHARPGGERLHDRQR